MNKPIALIIPWFGESLKGGAEQQAWQIATRLAARGHPVEVLTTCCRSFFDNWAENHLPAGATHEAGLTVRRFPVAERDHRIFDDLNRELLERPAGSTRNAIQATLGSPGFAAVLIGLVAVFTWLTYWYVFGPAPGFLLLPPELLGGLASRDFFGLTPRLRFRREPRGIFGFAPRLFRRFPPRPFPGFAGGLFLGLEARRFVDLLHQFAGVFVTLSAPPRDLGAQAFRRGADARRAVVQLDVDGSGHIGSAVQGGAGIAAPA